MASESVAILSNNIDNHPMNFSIIIITYNKREHLKKCLDSIKNTLPTALKFEVIIIFNGETSYLAATKNDYPEFKSIYISNRTPARARNFAAKVATGEYLFFLNDECFLPKDYFQKLLFPLKWDALGGPDETPCEATVFQRNLGKSLSSPLCMGASYKKHSCSPHVLTAIGTDENLSLSNLWLKRSLFAEENYEFPVDQFRNEENFVLKQLMQNSKSLCFDNQLFVYRTRKINIQELAKSIAKNGESMVINFFKCPKNHELLNFYPLIFVFLFFFWILSASTVVGYFFLFYIITIFFFFINRDRKLSRHIFSIIFLHFFIQSFFAIGIFQGIMNPIAKLLRKSFSKAIF